VIIGAFGTSVKRTKRHAEVTENQSYQAQGEERGVVPSEQEGDQETDGETRERGG